MSSLLIGEMPTSFTAALVSNVGKDPLFEVKELPLPILGPTDVLVKLAVTGICGTDYALASGELGPTCSILGHEGVGRVVRIGEALSETNIRLGQRVGVTWIRDVCGVCDMCLQDGGETRCAQQVFSGRKVDGTFAQYTIVPHRYILQLPEDVPDELLAPVLCGGVTAYKGLKICGAVSGSWIAISGAGGGVGALGIQYARAMGYRVIAIDAGSAKQNYCLDLGAHHYIDASAHLEIADTVKILTNGKGVAAILVATGISEAYQSALELLAPFGTLVCIGIPPPHQNWSIHPLNLIDGGIRIVGSMVGTRGDILEAVEFVQRGVVVPVVQKARLKDLQEIARKFKSGEILGKYVIEFDSAT